MISKKFIMWNSVEHKEQYEMGIWREEECRKTKDMLELVKNHLGQFAWGGKTGRKYVSCQTFLKKYFIKYLKMY